jgi:hypothetical protein
MPFLGNTPRERKGMGHDRDNNDERPADIGSRAASDDYRHWFMPTTA